MRPNPIGVIMNSTPETPVEVTQADRYAAAAGHRITQADEHAIIERAEQLADAVAETPGERARQMILRGECGVMIREQPAAIRAEVVRFMLAFVDHITCTGDGG